MPDNNLSYHAGSLMNHDERVINSASSEFLDHHLAFLNPTLIQLASDITLSPEHHKKMGKTITWLFLLLIVTNSSGHFHQGTKYSLLPTHSPNQLLSLDPHRDGKSIATSSGLSSDLITNQNTEQDVELKEIIVVPTNACPICTNQLDFQKEKSSIYPR
ncbi:hypothetical protein PCASD_13079 [Puccinia coronata f. sp. avenae]|uniref:Uncharacterized protein n=1 Tax=Puccinia coronata f. sp. avenae TaxID=200324 RepID=A0A2N5U8N2_9BASI|nr:hypothetical protein PCASD_13079 [Puccinia coronata f. sp. avenae]